MPPVSTGTAVIGGAVVVLGELTSLQADSDISYSFDSADKDAKRIDDANCDNCEWVTSRETVRTLKYKTNLFKSWDNLRIRLKIRWEHNGCDIKGAAFYFSSSAARLGHSAYVEGSVLSTGKTSAGGCETCCEKSACIVFKYTITVKRPLQSARLHEGEATVCGDGKFKHTLLT